jgi:hypothetical protein
MAASGTPSLIMEETRERLLSWFRSRAKRLAPGTFFWLSQRRGRPERDAKENRESSPPETEQVRLLALWMVEYFPPSRHQKRTWIRFLSSRS